MERIIMTGAILRVQYKKVGDKYLNELFIGCFAFVGVIANKLKALR